MLTPKDAILFKIVHTCAKECLILKYKYIQNPWFDKQLNWFGHFMHKYVQDLETFSTRGVPISYDQPNLAVYFEFLDPVTYIQGRSQTSYTAPCYGVISHGAQIEGIWVFADHTHENTRKQNASTVFACCAAFHTCLFSRSDRSTYAPDESQIPPIRAPCQDKNGVWDLPCISVDPIHHSLRPLCTSRFLRLAT